MLHSVVPLPVLPVDAPPLFDDPDDTGGLAPVNTATWNWELGPVQSTVPDPVVHEIPDPTWTGSGVPLLESISARLPSVNASMQSMEPLCMVTRSLQSAELTLKVHAASACSSRVAWASAL
jgi:hypothetical protein